MFKRCQRLFPAFWIVLIVCVCVHGTAPSWLSVAFNAVGLSWFFKLPGCGYLWFVTAILIFYCLSVLMSHIPAKGIRSILTIPLSFVCALGVQLLMVKMHVSQSWFVPYMWTAGIAFLYGDRLVGVLKQKGGWFLSATGIALVCAGGLGLALHLDFAAFSRCWFASLLAVGVVVVLLALETGRRASVVLLVSGLSYELYLVHEFFCYGLPLRTFCPNVGLYLCSFLICSIMAAWLLKQMTKLVTRTIFRWAA